MGTTKFFMLFLLSFSGFSMALAGDFADPPSSAFLKIWKPNGAYVSSAIDYNALPEKKVLCEDLDLYPTHPSMRMKLYHRYEYGYYDYQNMSGDDPVCIIKGKFKNSRGQLFCFKSDYVERAVLSDTYQDRCGNFYRGFSAKQFMHRDDNMGTLFSLGRAMYPNTKSKIDGDMVVGGTYSVPSKEFLKLTELFPTDAAEIAKSRENITNEGLTFNRTSLLFERKD